ncbi:alpha/beta hydrolase [Goodfellowiella coeruleoviolacea]|uniref:Lysophospholipase, alpha-beta hydrolase superfamily n=1 Tax=Goodfellowiella coeruleoviolacea TaxID=334858 RepID=A0AAE3G9V0_9PSEU|nr:lysophospholipase [Goodfellowiella coeruleoviolacea]MCP2164327.1 Lysophospholipase, alpha-beta hydrolase superfamily [Goodfellowiella coeruleoviolacea]
MTIESTLSWHEPTGLTARGTLVVLPGRGEQPGLYERFGRRLAADAYQVHVVGDASPDPEATGERVRSLLAVPDLPRPSVLVGSDTGALLALRLVALGGVAVEALVLAGLPVPGAGASVAAESEAETRASCPTHQNLLRTKGLFHSGRLTDQHIPALLRDRVDPAAVTVPVLGLHGDNDVVSPLQQVESDYAALPHAHLVAVSDGRHDVLNAANHRSVAARIVLFLEQLRAGSGPSPILVERAA